MALADHPHISLQTRRRVQRLSERLGYRRRSPKRTEDGRWKGLAGKRLGMFFVGSPVHDSIIVHQVTLQSQIARASLQMAAVESRDPLDAVAPFVDFASDLDGVILTGYIGYELLARAKQMQVPCVLFGSMLQSSPHRPRPYGHTINGDYLNMARMAVDWLFSDGHERIGFVGGRAPAGLWIDQWLSGYQLALLQSKLRVEDSYVLLSGADDSWGEGLADQMMAMKDQPTAFVIPEPRLAESFLNRLRQHGVELPQRAVVLGKDPVKARVPGLADLPAIFVESQRMTDVTFETLGRAMARELIENTDVVVGPSLRNPPSRRQES